MIAEAKQNISAFALRIERLIQAANAKFGCLMAMIPELKDELITWATENIDESTLVEDGIEKETHCTVLYGFEQKFKAKNLRTFLSHYGDVKLKIGKLSRFESEEYDVIKFTVDSQDLRAMHEKLEKEFKDEITPSKWGYNPHITVAYVKKGSNESIDGSQFEGRNFIISELLYSLPEKKGRFLIPLNDDILKSSDINNLADRISRLFLKCSRADTQSTKSNEDADKSELELHDKARDAAEEIYRQTALAAAAKIQEEKDKKKREAAILLLLLLAGEEAYLKTYSILGTKELLNRDEIQIEEQSKTFALARQPLLKKYAEKLSKSVAKVESQSEAEELSETETVREIRQIAEKVSTVMAQTEAQITYGVCQEDRVKRMGAKLKRWQTCEDERVRPTHEACQLEGAIPIDRKFGNGLAFPGDPSGDIQELAGCRCWLLPVIK